VNVFFEPMCPRGMIELKSEFAAIGVAKILNEFKLGSNITLQALTVKSLENIMSYPDFYTPLALP